MAFNIANLTLVSYGNGRGVYTYKSTADNLNTIKASGYFGQDSTTGQQSSDMLNAGDVILCEGTDGYVSMRVDTVSGNTVTTEMGFGESTWITVPITTISTAGGQYVPAPFDGVVSRIKAVTNGEIDTTTTITAKIAGTAITGGTIALDQSGQGAGEVYQTYCTAGNAVSEGTAVQISWDGAAVAEPHAVEPDVIVLIEFVPV